MSGYSGYFPKSPGHQRSQVSSSMSMRNPLPWKPTGKLSSTFPGTDHLQPRPVTPGRPTVTTRLPKRDQVDGSPPGKADSSVQHLEDEYIRNLQQQIYFLELESNYLRQQAQKAHDNASNAVEKAEKKTASKASLLQEEFHTQIANLQNDLRRKDDFLQKVDAERQQLREHVKALEATITKDRHSLMEDVATAQRETKQHVSDMKKLRQHEEHLQQTMLTRKRRLDNANKKCQTLQQQLDQANSRVSDIDARATTFKEKCTELECRVEAGRQREDEHRDCVQRSHYTAMKDDSSSSRAKLSKAELSLDSITAAKAKVDSTCGSLIEDHSRLQTETLELRSQLESMNSLLEHRDQQKHALIRELVELRQYKDEMKSAMAVLEQRLINQDDTVRSYAVKIKNMEDTLEEANMEVGDLRTRLAKVDVQHRECQQENLSLASNSALLQDHLTEKDTLVHSHQTEVSRLKATNASLRASLAELGARKGNL
ncbi:uncharacterized protein LOC135828552 [Sycon ciliatum]|uniref:uncharacterized protein LOC135828552 n=1 Tax=Sycon ciliatum TaxID=27933 RepID=UPI0031F608A0